jgi:hypothetical protein
MEYLTHPEIQMNRNLGGQLINSMPEQKNRSVFFKEDIIQRWQKKNQRLPTMAHLCPQMALLCPQTLPKQGRFSEVVACASVFWLVWIGLFISVSRNPKHKSRNLCSFPKILNDSLPFLLPIVFFDLDS